MLRQDLNAQSTQYEASLHRDFGQWIKKKREERGITRAQAVDLYGMAHNQISTMEDEGRGVRRPTVMRLAIALSVDMDEALMMAGWCPMNPLRLSLMRELLVGSRFVVLGDALREMVHVAANLSHAEQVDLARMIREYSELLIHKRKGGSLYERPQDTP